MVGVVWEDRKEKLINIKLLKVLIKKKEMKSFLKSKNGDRLDTYRLGILLYIR